MAGQVRVEELLAKAVTVDGRKEWYCRVCWETTRSRFRSFQTNVPSVLQGKYKLAVSDPSSQASMKTKCRRTKPTGQKRQIYGNCVKKTRGSRMKEGRKSSVQFEDAGTESTFADEGKMEVDEEFDSKNIWISERLAWAIAEHQ